MAKQQPNRRGQVVDAVRSGSVMAGLSLLLILPAAFLIREGVLPESSTQLSALACAGVSALILECAIFGKRRAGYAYVPHLLFQWNVPLSFFFHGIKLLISL